MGKTSHEHQLRVPLIVRPPQSQPSSRRVSSHVRLVDLMPTLLAVAGVEPPTWLQGVDASSRLRGDTVGTSLPVFSTGVVGEPEVYSLIDGGYKLIVDLEHEKPALYDLESDPGERANIARREVAVTKAMLEQLRGHVEETAVEALEQRTIELPEELHEPLRGLGYLD